jgi:hypothetical protein
MLLDFNALLLVKYLLANDVQIESHDMTGFNLSVYFLLGNRYLIWKVPSAHTPYLLCIRRFAVQVTWRLRFRAFNTGGEQLTVQFTSPPFNRNCGVSMSR